MASEIVSLIMFGLFLMLIGWVLYLYINGKTRREDFGDIIKRDESEPLSDLVDRANERRDNF